MQPPDLAGLPRKELIDRATRLGVEKANVLTRAELCDEILRRSVEDPVQRRIARGLLGLARDLVASVVERGLHLPDAAERIRAIRHKAPSPKPPLATVTLAEIYASQGHKARAKTVLDEVLAAEPDHAAARALRDRIGEPAEAEAEQAPPPAEPAPEEPALERYGVDALAMVPVDPTTVYLRWEIRDATMEKLRAGAKGVAVMRVVAVTATWDGPIVESREIELTGAAGERFVGDLPDGALVRAAAGWRSDGAFDPVAVAVEVAAKKDEAAEGESVAPPASAGIPDGAVRESFEQARCRASLEPAGEEKTMVSWEKASPVAWAAPAASEGAGATA